MFVKATKLHLGPILILPLALELPHLSQFSFGQMCKGKVELPDSPLNKHFLGQPHYNWRKFPENSSNMAAQVSKEIHKCKKEIGFLLQASIHFFTFIMAFMYYTYDI